MNYSYLGQAGSPKVTVNKQIVLAHFQLFIHISVCVSIYIMPTYVYIITYGVIHNFRKLKLTFRGTEQAVDNILFFLLHPPISRGENHAAFLDVSGMTNYDYFDYLIDHSYNLCAHS